MARSNGPFGPAGARPPARRHPADDPYAPPPQPQSPHQYADPGLPPAPSQGYHFPPEPEPNFGHNGQQPGQYDRYQAHDPYAQAQWGQQDQRGYDLGNYTPNGAQPYANGAGYPNAPQGFPNVGPPFANGAQPYGGAADPYPQMDDPPFQTGGAGNHDPYAQQGFAEGEGEYEDELVEEERSGRGRRWMFIVAALVGAVGVGGALAYTYKSFMAPSAGRVPLVKADPNVKVKADNRTLPSNDRRQQGRLGEDDGQQRAAAATDTQDDRGSDEPGGPRRVRTIPITPGGAPPGIQVSQPPPVQAGAPPVVPGIMLDNMAPRGQQPPPAPAAAPPQRVVIGQPPPAQAAPQHQESAPPPVRKVAVPAAQAAPPPPRLAPQAAPASRTVAPAPPQASTGAGYVAVLSSQKTRMDALKAFADLQQKYGEALSGRVPDVQEADLGAKGVWYRVVVGPPGSRDAANGVCSQLKTAGYGQCWVNAY